MVILTSIIWWLVIDEAVLLTFFNCLQVLVGNYTIGDEDIARPPENEHGDLYDSCVDNETDPMVFVTFDIAHSYPEYLNILSCLWRRD